MVAAIFFTEIADRDWNAVASKEVNWKKKMTPRAASTASTMSRNIFWRQYLWKKYDLPQYQIFCLIVWKKMIECHGARPFFFLAVSHGANTFFHTKIYICTGPMPQYILLDPLGKQMDIFLATLYTLLERLPFGLLSSNICLRDVYRTRRFLKCILEAHFMRSAVPFFVILSLTHTNQKYLKNLVAYTFWHHYRTNFVETKFFSHYSKPSCGLQSVVNARLPR